MNIAALEKELVKRFNTALLFVLRRRFVPEYVSAFDKLYDELLVAPYPIKQEDLTSPDKIKPNIISYITDSLNASLSQVDISSKISFGGIEKTIIGYPEGPDRQDTDVLKLFYFYVEGTIGDYALITIDFLSELDPMRGERYLGRFGNVFLMPMYKFRKMYAAIASSSNERTRALAAKYTPDKVRHPYSGAPPSRIFERVREKIDFGSYFDDAKKMLTSS